MFIFLDKSLANDRIFKSNIAAFINIAQAAQYGNHYISGDYKIMNYLARSQDLPEYARSIYRYLVNFQLSNSKSIQEQLEICIQVVARDDGKRVEESSGFTKILIGISEFKNSSLIQKTILLGENSKDSRIYKKIAETYTKERKVNIQIACQPDMGGGSTIAIKFDLIQKNNEDPRFCICIVDSDRKAPLCGLGDTAQKLQETRYGKNNPSLLCDIHIISVRDVENLLFFEVLEYMWQKTRSGNQYREDINFFRHIYLHHNEYIDSNKKRTSHFVLRYADFKEGINLRRILSLNPKDPIRQFWIGYAQHLFQRSDLSRSFIQENCIKNENCSSKKTCICFITPRLGAILETIDKFFEDNPKSTFLDIMDNAPCLDNPRNPNLAKEWETIGKKVTSWCCSMPRISTSPRD